MSYLINNQQNLNEIIFANRNKSYGAYAIRSAYGNTIVKSLSIMIFEFGTFRMAAYYFSNRNNTPEQSNIIPLDADTMVTVFNIKPEEPLEMQREHSDPPKSNPNSSSTTMSTRIVDSAAVNTNSVLNTDTGPHIAVNTTSPGVGPETNTFISTGSGTTTAKTNNDPKIFVDSQPEFAGGLNALRKFVAERIHYPAIALDEGKGGTVYVKFVVDEKGKVSSLTLLNNLGYGLDQEALRVVGLIPDFIKPAMVGGEPVKVYYQLPIKFTVAK